MRARPNNRQGHGHALGESFFVFPPSPNPFFSALNSPGFVDFSVDSVSPNRYPEKPFPQAEASDGDPIYHKELGGGALLWAGPYPIAAGVMPFGKCAPTRAAAAGVRVFYACARW